MKTIHKSLILVVSHAYNNKYIRNSLKMNLNKFLRKVIKFHSGYPPSIALIRLEKTIIIMMDSMPAKIIKRMRKNLRTKR
jgi:hypothetical protein